MADPRELIPELCRQFYQLGWVSGTGGGVSVRVREKCGDRFYVAPSGVQKERIRPDEIFVLDKDQNVLEHPGNGLRLSACTPLFYAAYDERNAGAVIHSHSINATLATRLFADRFQSRGYEMQKGIQGHGVQDALEVPIIENTEHEADLTDALTQAIRENPRTQAVLVRDHGVYVWGNTWQQAKTQAECYDFLFAVALRTGGR